MSELLSASFRFPSVQSFYHIASGPRSGFYNMALDEVLLEWVRAQATPVLIVRTYEWEEPTLSLGVNQPVRDLNFLLSFYGKSKAEDVKALVCRPTGGRAILHGEDISYAFITNEPTLLRQSLKVLYQVFAGWVQCALEQLQLPVHSSESAGERDYVRSPICFETQTPSDLVTPAGQKLTGSAQLRRAGGLLQHGAAFLKPFNVSAETFSQRLFETVQAQEGLPSLTPFPLALVESALLAQEAACRKVSDEIRASASTTSGSHLAPASF